MRDGGVRYYTPAQIQYAFGFPEDDLTCFGCRFCYHDGVGRDRCSITGDIVLHVHTERGYRCPVVFDEEVE